MLSRLIFFFGVLLFPVYPSLSQDIPTLIYSNKVVIPYNQSLDGTNIGGISGITYNSKDNFYYLVADKPPARLYRVSISNDSPAAINFVKSIELAPAPLEKSELEGIAFNHKTDGYYASDEQKEGTRLLELDKNAELIKIIEPINKPFLPLSGHNSGIEGLTINEDISYMYYSFERPTLECQEKGLVEIRRKSLGSSKEDMAFYHKLHRVNGDIIKTNGISDILYLDKNSLLVMERAYIPGIGNIVRIFLARLDDQLLFETGNKCQDDSIQPISAKLLFDFVTVPDVKIDNAEGMTFNEDRSKLYIVTDNNFSKKQQTQIIVLDVEW